MPKACPIQIIGGNNLMMKMMIRVDVVDGTDVAIGAVRAGNVVLFVVIVDFPCQRTHFHHGSIA